MFVDGCMHLKVLTLRSKEVPRKAWAGYADLWIIHVSSSLKVIGGDAFRGVAQLTMLDLTAVTSMGERTFEEYSSLVEVTLGDGITCIGGTALDGTIVGRVAVLAKLPMHSLISSIARSWQKRRLLYPRLPCLSPS